MNNSPKDLNGAPPTPSAEGFERVFAFVGGHGRFQWRLWLIISLELTILMWHHIGYTFLGAVPNHWCSIPQLKESGWSVEQIKLISIPRVDEESHILQSTNSFKQCEYFDLRYDDILRMSNYNFEVAYSRVDWGNVSTKSCEQWDYDKSIYESTVATQFNLVCGNRWKTATIQGSYMAAVMVGSISFGSLSDRFLGRRRSILIALTLVICGGILTAFSTSYWMFLFFRILIAIGVSGSTQNCIVLLTEHSDKEYRALLSIFAQLPFAIGYMILPGLAYIFREWHQLQLSFGIISITLVVYYWIMPESPRWLATHGHTERAIDALYNVARVNKMPKPNRDDLLEIVKNCFETGDAVNSKHENDSTLEKVKRGIISIGAGFKSLTETAEIRKRTFVFWFLFIIVCMVYYGTVFLNLSKDPFLVVFLGGLMEIPAYTAIVPFVSKLGRRPTTVGTFMLTGILMLAMSLTPNEYEVIRIILAMSAKLFIASVFAIIYLLGAELYPTSLRTTGIAVGIFMGRIGAITAPYVVDLLQTVYQDLPILIFATFAVAAGLVSFSLPETKTLEMSDNLFEIEMHAEIEKANEQKRKLSLVK